MIKEKPGTQRINLNTNHCNAKNIKFNKKKFDEILQISRQWERLFKNQTVIEIIKK